MPHKDPVARREYMLKYQRAWRAANRKKSTAYTQAWRKRYPDRAARVDQRSSERARQLYASSAEHRFRVAMNGVENKYGITREQYADMLERQGGRCAICRTDKPGGKRRIFSVDHDHRTGAVRALLCIHCNIGLGAFKDDHAVLRCAYQYLVDHAPEVE